MKREERLVRRMTIDTILAGNSLRKIKEVGRDISDHPLMILIMRGFFKDEEWIDYLAMILDMEKMVESFGKRLEKFFIKSSKDSGAVHGCDANFCGTHH